MAEPKKSTSLLQIDDLSVAYATTQGDVPAVTGLTLTIEPGEIVGVAGESGSGKTTLAVALLRLLKPPGKVTGGSVTFTPRDGRSVDLLKVTGGDLRKLRWRNIAYLPQGSMNSLNPVAKIRSQFADVIIEHASERRGDLNEMVPRLLRLVGLEPRVADMYPHELSGGMRQRVLMAICIALEPDLIVADEPTTALDVTIQRVILQSLADLRRDFGVAIMVISHDMGVHAQLVDRVAVMYEGALVEVGDVGQVFKNPQHEYTRNLIASIPDMAGTATGATASRLPVSVGAGEQDDAGDLQHGDHTDAEGVGRD